MKEDRNLYMYVYRMLLTSIYNGTYKSHEKLPSLSDLCTNYHVGRNTIRSALAKLQEDGYVSLQKGVHASVCFDVEDLNTNFKYRQSLMDAMNMTKDVYETMSCILPELFVLCFRKGKLDMEEMNTLLQNFTIDNIHNEVELIQRMYKIYLSVFKSYENPIIIDLFYTLLSYSYQPIVSEQQTQENLKRSVNGIRKCAYLIFKFIRAKQEKFARNMIKFIIKMHAANSMRNINKICHDVQEVHPTSFVWVCNRTSEYLYSEVIIALISDIAHKKYQIDEVLPSIEQLSKMYSVSQRTVRKALDVLRQYEIIETINGRGSIVLQDHFKVGNNIAQNPEVKQSLLVYKYTLETFVVIFEKVANEVLKTISKQELLEISKQIEKQESKTLEPFSTFLFDRCNPCLTTIYKELLKTLNWCVVANMIEINDAQRFIVLRSGVVRALQGGKTSAIVEACMQVLHEDEKHIHEILKEDVELC